MEPLAGRSTSLGSLAQKARAKHIKSARTSLFAIGILTILVNGGLAAFANEYVESQFQKEIQEETRKQPGIEFDPARLAELKSEAVLRVQFLSGVGVLLGTVFVIFGFVVKKAPVAITASALAIYIGLQAILAAFDPTTLLQGWWLKLIFIFALVKGLQAAIAYQKEASVPVLEEV